MSLSKKSQGFTLIELLVVIAIIGILAAIVLASLTTSRDQASEKAIQSQMSSMRAQGELYFSTNGNTFVPSGTAAGGATVGQNCGVTTSVFAGTTNSLKTLLDATPLYGGLSTNRDCDADATGWAVAYQVSPTLFYCVDSTGYLGSKTKTSGTTYVSINGSAAAFGAKQAAATSCN